MTRGHNPAGSLCQGLCQRSAHGEGLPPIAMAPLTVVCHAIYLAGPGACGLLLRLRVWHSLSTLSIHVGSRCCTYSMHHACCSAPTAAVMAYFVLEAVIAVPKVR